MKNSSIRKVKVWCKNNWWVLTLVSIIIMATLVVGFGKEECFIQINRFGELATNLLTPTCLVLGLVLGYPLLKHKLVDGYITKQFEIIHNANSCVRKQCLLLCDKYTPKVRANLLERKDILEALEDIKTLNEIAMDANENVYRYTHLVYWALVDFEDKTRKEDIHTPNNCSYREVFHTWLHQHISQIYQYARSIGFLPQMEVERHNVLVDRIGQFVSDNTYYSIKHIDKSIQNPPDSALLVVFASINNTYLGDKDFMLFESCFMAAPLPCPFARLMYNNCVYFPPILSGEKVLNVFQETFYLVGFKRVHITKVSDGTESYHYKCIYANLSNVSWSTNKSISDIGNYRDSYLDEDINTEGIEELTQHGNIICINIPENIAEINYERIASKLKIKLEKELQS